MPLALEPQEVLVTYEHAATRTRWFGGRGRHSCGRERRRVSRFAGDKIAEVWLWDDGYQAAHELVFSFDQRSSE